MIITLKMLLTKLPKHLPDPCIYRNLPYSEIPLSGIRLLSESVQPGNNYLYLTEKKSLASKAAKKAVLSLLLMPFLCTDADINTEIPVICTDANPADVLNALQEIYSSYQNWDRSMHEALIAHSELQKLLNLSAPIIGHPILIYDNGMKLIGFQDSEKDNDVLFEETIKKGYLTSDGLAQLEQAGVFQNDCFNEIQTFQFGPSARIETMYIALADDRKKLGYSVMLLEKGYDREYESISFRNLSEFIQAYLKEQQRNSIAEGYMYEFIVQDLLNNQDPDESYINDRLRHMQISPESEFYLILIDGRTAPAATKLFLTRTLRAEYMNVMICEYQDYLLFLIYKDPKLSLNNYKKSIQQQYSLLFQELIRHHIPCYIGMPFFHMSQLRDIYLMLTDLSDRKAINDNSYITFFEDHIPEQLFRMAPGKEYIRHFVPTPLIILKEQGSEKTPSDYDILKIYIRSGQRASDTAKLLHMTRNNVLYHIRRMENLYHLDFDDTDFSFQLQLGFYLMDYLES